MPRVRRSAILGLDLSTRASACIALPGDWRGDWSLMRELVVGRKLEHGADEEERAARNEYIAEEIVSFAVDYHVSEAWIEGYAFGKNTMAHTLGELGGVVRHELRRAGVALRTANMSTARKLLLGNIPRGQGAAKKAAHGALRAAGMPFRGDKAYWLDLTDAFVSANLGLSQREGFCFAQAPRRP